jgi:hypothetical protein
LITLVHEPGALLRDFWPSYLENIHWDWTMHQGCEPFDASQISRIMVYPEGDVIQPVLYKNWQMKKTPRDQQPVNILPGTMPKDANIISPQTSKR